MITNKKTSELEFQSAGGSKDFTIRASGKMFDMVVSGLYSNKPESVTREIWSNAFDAHAMAGIKDKPFDIKFPSMLSPEFSCRDYGPGIPHDFMEELYTVLGHSEKENTNDAVGCFGVGRVSPLSYTDSFTVTSWHGGKMQAYTIVRGPDGAPKLITLCDPMDSTEPSGVRVSFPIHQKDIGYFASAAKRVSLGFDIKPTVAGKEYEWPSLDVAASGVNWFAFRNTTEVNLGSNTSFVKMGCVLYPIDRNIMSDFPRNLVVEAKIGDVTMLASREGLQYGRFDNTKVFLEGAIKNIADEFAESLKDVVSNAVSLYDCVQKVHNLTKGTSFLANITQVVEFRGTKIEYHQYGVRNCFLGPHIGNASVLTHDTTSNYRYYSSKRRSNTTVSPKQELELRHEAMVFLVDTSQKKLSRVYKRIKLSLETSYAKFNGHVYTLTYDGSQGQGQADLKTVQEYFKGATIVAVDTLPDVPAAKRTKRPVSVKKWNGRYWESVDLDDTQQDEGGLYIDMYGQSADPTAGDWQSHLVVAAALTGKTVTLYGLPKTVQKPFHEHDKWVNLKDYTKSLATANMQVMLDGAIKGLWCGRVQRAASYADPSNKLLWKVKQLNDDANGKTLGLPNNRLATYLLGLGIVTQDWINSKKTEVCSIVTEAMLNDKYPMIDVISHSMQSLPEYVPNLKRYLSLTKE